ncbi:MAG: 2,3,4,5-tetrahydropyridine-2,6-dicarboxylate N-succinyltransferase, partial [Candidatus Sumerlaeia bacterium]|nr:2,3,4,5-tetrahydropyridine-2,6-dicarboxylate N-succinyltransferase [Candidatus Sumerlaeia bacterium]
MSLESLEATINAAWDNNALVGEITTRQAVADTLNALTAGEVRAATRQQDGQWKPHEWVKKAILLHFRLSDMRAMDAGVLHFQDKIDIQGGWAEKGCRVVPPATVRQ